MRAVKDLRTRLSLTQCQVAGFLGVSRGFINLVEMGDRELETYKFIRLIELTDIHEAENKQEIAVAMSKSMICVNEQDNRELRKMKHRSDQCRFKIKCLDRKLTKMKKECQKTISWLQTVEQRLAKLPVATESAGERLWLEIEQIDWTAKLRECGNMAQAKLRKKIHLYKAEAEINDELVGELEKAAMVNGDLVIGNQQESGSVGKGALALTAIKENEQAEILPGFKQEALKINDKAGLELDKDEFENTDSITESQPPGISPHLKIVPHRYWSSPVNAESTVIPGNFPNSNIKLLPVARAVLKLAQ